MLRFKLTDRKGRILEYVWADSLEEAWKKGRKMHGMVCKGVVHAP